MRDKIELLRDSLIDDYKDFALDVLGISSRLGRGLGWHYLLDLIWILKELDGDDKVVLDAGGGTGLTQFLLADLGYNVISADVSYRDKPHFANNMYNIKKTGTSEYIDHPYLQWHELLQKGDKDRKDEIKEDLPTIIFYHTDLEKMPVLDSESVDVIVSVSALEHNPPEKLPPVLKEMERVLKPGGRMLITLSAAEENSFHEPSFSWLMNEKGLIDNFDLGEDTISDFSDFSSAFKELKNSERLKRWLGTYYFQGGKNGMPWGIWEPEYQPVGIVRYKK